MRDYDADERPIPLGRARVREAEAEGRPAAHIEEEDAGIELGRPTAVVVEAPVVAGAQPPESVSGPAATVLNEHPTQSWVSHTQLAPTAAELAAAADAHPLVAFLRFRLTVEVVERAHGSRWTGLGRLLLIYALVMALVLALILAFAVLVAHGGRAAP